MVMAASGSKSAAGATMKSAAQSNTKTATGPRGPTGPSNSQPRSSPAGNAGGGPGSVSRSNPSASQGGGGGSNRGNVSTTSRIGSAASAQRMSSQQGSAATSSAPNAAAAKASAAYRTSGALNAGLGRDPSPISGALNTSRSIAAPPALPQARTPAQVQNYLGSATATPFGGYQYGPGQMYSDPYRSRSALNSVLNNSKLAGHSPMQTSDAVLRSAGMTNPMARAGVLGTFDHESAGFNPTALGDQGTAYGLGQWRGPRQTGLQKYSAGMGLPTGTVGVQTAYALTEMGRAFPKTLNSLQAAQDVPSAVRAMNAYEKPRGYVAGGDPTAVAGWADRLARSSAALASVTKDQSRIPAGTTATAFTKDQSRLTPEVPVLTANAARVPTTNDVPSWRQSTYTGPQERILAIEDVPPLATTAQGGLGVFGVSSPLPSQRPISVPMESTTAQRNAFYGGGLAPRPGLTQGTGYGTFNGPTIVTTPDPNASLPNYAGFRQFAQPASPPIPRPRPEPQNYPVKPYGAKTKALINAPLGLIPYAGEVNTGLATVGYSVGDYIVNEQNKLANMTPEQRERYRQYWADRRSEDSQGGGAANRENLNVPSASRTPQVTRAPAETPVSGNWQADALAYGYSEAQLKDPEIRALIKELWDMGFIPKTSSA